MTAKKETKTKEWIIPPGLNVARKHFKAVCDVFFEEDEDNQKNRPIMVCGPTGVGKSCFTDFFIGKYFEKYPEKKKIPIESRNCAAFSEMLIESELFGHVKGAFTGATKDKKGVLDSEGLIILEEIGELPRHLQAKLLIVIENRTFNRVGSTDVVKFNGQIIATTNKTKVDFRSDFFYRFFPFFIPGIYERRPDVLYYLHYFDNEILRHLTKENILTLLSYHWPGNVREIQLFTRLFKITKARFEVQINVADLFRKDLPKNIFGKDEKLSLIDGGKHFFQIDPNYSEYDENKHLFFLINLFKGCDNKRLITIQKLEDLLDNCIGFSETDSPFPIPKEIEIIKDQIFYTSWPYTYLTETQDKKTSKLQETIEHFFITMENKVIDKISDAFDLFCILFFRSPQANHDLLDFSNFTIPEIEFNLKELKNIFTNINNKELEKISLEILSLFSKKEGIGQYKNLPLKYTERKKIIKTLYAQNKGNEFLSELMGISKTDQHKMEAEIDITSLKENELIQSYFGMLFQVISKQEDVAKAAGLHPSTLSQRLKKKKLDKKKCPYTLKAYKKNKN